MVERPSRKRRLREARSRQPGRTKVGRFGFVYVQQSTGRIVDRDVVEDMSRWRGAVGRQL